MLSTLPDSDASHDECKEGLYHLAGSLGNFGQKPVHVLFCATANVESALARGSRVYFLSRYREINTRDGFRHIYR